MICDFEASVMQSCIDNPINPSNTWGQLFNKSNSFLLTVLDPQLHRKQLQEDCFDRYSSYRTCEVVVFTGHNFAWKFTIYGCFEWNMFVRHDLRFQKLFSHNTNNTFTVQNLVLKKHILHTRNITWSIHKLLTPTTNQLKLHQHTCI